MKRKVMLVFLCFIGLFFSGSKTGNTKMTTLTIGHTSHAETDLHAAAESVKKKFSDFRGCTLTELVYEEEKAVAEIKTYLKSGGGSGSGLSSKDIIVFTSTFEVDGDGAENTLNPNSTYTNWLWFVVKAKNSGKWEVQDFGY
ncbi:DUF4829 domain-containing protein [Enterococcus sp. LJL128]|uniref:DUF4829 domain-containing protein n=1 Tax=Enterococcus sp. LJL51 TaxID=3416656 RepID=UPI003CE8C0C6